MRGIRGARDWELRATDEIGRARQFARPFGLMFGCIWLVEGGGVAGWSD